MMPAQSSTVGAVATVDSGPAFRSSDFREPGQGIPLLRGDNIEPGTLRWSRTKTWPPELLAGYEHLHVRDGDLILGMDRPIISSGLKLARVTEADLPALLVQRVARIRPTEIDGRYLYYWLSSLKFIEHLKKSATGTQLPHVTLASIRQFQVPRFGPAKECHIVDILDRILPILEAAEAAMRRTAKRLRALERSALDEHFAPGRNSVPLGSLVASIEAGKSFGGSNSPASETEWGIIKVSAMTWGEFRPQENKVVPSDRVDPRYEIHEGDLLLSRANTSNYVGASVLVGPVRSQLLLSDKSLRIVPQPGVRSDWLWRALQAPSSRRQISSLATGTKESMRNISQASLRRVMLPCISTADQERAIAGFERARSASDRLNREIVNQMSRLTNFRRSLLEAAFSGQLTQGSDHEFIFSEKDSEMS